MKATLKQAAKILSLFEETSSEKIQSLIESGFLADIRDADVVRINRDEVRKVLGLDPLRSILWTMATLPESVIRAEVLTELYALVAFEIATAVNDAWKRVLKQLHDADVFFARFGRDAETWQEFVDLQIQSGYVQPEQGLLVLTPRGRSRLNYIRSEAQSAGYPLPC